MQQIVCIAQMRLAQNATQATLEQVVKIALLNTQIVPLAMILYAYLVKQVSLLLMKLVKNVPLIAQNVILKSAQLVLSQCNHIRTLALLVTLNAELVHQQNVPHAMMEITWQMAIASPAKVIV